MDDPFSQTFSPATMLGQTSRAVFNSNGGGSGGDGGRHVVINTPPTGAGGDEGSGAPNNSSSSSSNSSDGIKNGNGGNEGTDKPTAARIADAEQEARFWREVPQDLWDRVVQKNGE